MSTHAALESAVIASLVGGFAMENYLKKCFFRGYDAAVKLFDTLAATPPIGAQA